MQMHSELVPQSKFKMSVLFAFRAFNVRVAPLQLEKQH